MYYSISMYMSCFYIFLNNDMYSYTLWYVQFRPGISWPASQKLVALEPDWLAMRLLLTVLDVVTQGALIFLDELPDQRLVIRCLVADLLCLAGWLVNKPQQAADLKTSQQHIPSGNLKSRIPTYPWTLLEARCTTSHNSSAYNWSTHSGYPPKMLWNNMPMFKEI